MDKQYAVLIHGWLDSEFKSFNSLEDARSYLEYLKVAASETYAASELIEYVVLKKSEERESE